MAGDWLTFEEQLEKSFPSGTGAGQTPGTGVATQEAGAPEPVKAAPLTASPAPAAAAAPAPSGGSTLVPAPLATPIGPTSSSTGAATVDIKDILSSPDPAGPYASLFAPQQKAAQNTLQSLQVAAGKFNEGVTPFRTFESSGAEGTLRGAFAPDTSTQEAKDQAKALVGASYGGPEGFDLEALAGLQTSAGDLRQRADSLQRQSGIENLVGEHSSGLTPGERAFEASRLRGSTDFGEAVQAGRRAAAGVTGEIQRASDLATSTAAARKEQETDIAKRSRDLLTGARTDVSDEIAAQVAAAQAEQKAAADAAAAFHETGSLEDLAKIPESARAGGWDPESFNTEARQTKEKADRVLADVMSRYPDIADVPLLTLQTTKKGRETLGFPADWYEANKNRKTKEEMNRIREQATARQRELEASGFTSKYWKDRYTSVVDDPMSPGGLAQGSEFGLVMPLYFGEGLEQKDFTPADVRGYVEFDPGLSPARENISTKEQRAIYNNIQEILDDADRIAEAGEPYRAASMAADVATYLADEEAILGSRKEGLTSAQGEWMNTVRAARKNYERRKTKATWGKVFGYLSGTGPLGENLGGTFGYGGYQMAEKFVP